MRPSSFAADAYGADFLGWGEEICARYNVTVPQSLSSKQSVLGGEFCRSRQEADFGGH
jgi:hypothetical protein